jgi:hypothetical protein
MGKDLGTYNARGKHPDLNGNPNTIGYVRTYGQERAFIHSPQQDETERASSGKSTRLCDTYLKWVHGSQQSVQSFVAEHRLNKVI